MPAVLPAVALIAWLAAPAELYGGDLPALPGPAPRARATDHDPAAANEACASCHVEIAAEWKRSLHRQAWEDPVFQQAYAIEPEAFCRGCHAPEADPESFPSAGARSVGVGCTTCHVQGGEIVGVHASPPEGRRHAVRGDARMATRDACGACHQFEFPRSPGVAMQDTLSEHAASSYAGIACQGCHMPPVASEDGGRHRSHDFSVVGNAALLAEAVDVTAAREGSSALAVTLTADRVGHAFPTGDMFRRLELRAELLDAEGNVVETAPAIHLARKFGDRRASPDGLATKRVEIGDTRVPPPGRGAREALLRFPVATAHRTIRWTLAYQRMDHAMAASFGIDQAHDETIVARGILPPTPASSP